jgi:extracellular factor (EF) 3-hydroxypalmitic acid methyl ester biosynthesis protein
MPTKDNQINAELRDSVISFQTGTGSEVHATLLRLTRFLAVFEIYNAGGVVRMSEVLRDFKILSNGRTVYCGRAVINNLIDMGGVTVCEAKIEESGLLISHLSSPDGSASPNGGFGEFFRNWEKTYKVLPDFKLVMADMQMLLLDLRLWLEEVELGIRSQPAGSLSKMEEDFLPGLVEPLGPTLGRVVERFEAISARIERDLKPVHGLYARRQLHPVVLCSPFLCRTYQKPLGYAGDYEMVNMMVRNPFEGASVFAKVINTFFLNTAPVIAHRNRITYLQERLVEEVYRGARRRKPIKIFNLGCGPAFEIQQFLRRNESLCEFAEFTLVDFNDETIEHARRVLGRIKTDLDRHTPIEFQHKSVHHVLRESNSKPIVNGSGKRHDLVYCTGLFDYLSDRTCKQLMNIFWEWLAPGGLLIVSNVDESNPSRGWMEYVLDWNLIYRNSRQMTALIPDKAPADAARLIAEPSGVNIFLQIRKPDHV